MGVDRCVDTSEAGTRFAYPAMPPIAPVPERPERPDPWLRAAFVGLGLIGLVVVFAGPVVGLVLALLAGGVGALARGHHGSLHRNGRGDGTSGGLRPWPHVAMLPLPLAGTELLDTDRCGVVWHRPTGLMSATALLAPCPAALREAAVAETYAACWWALLETASARAEIHAAAITVDVLPSGEQHPVRLTLTVDPAAWGPVSSVAHAAALTGGALRGLDVTAAGLVKLRPATAAELARITRAAFEPLCRWSEEEAEPIAWGELAPETETELSRVYRHERYQSVSWALRVPPGQHVRAEAIPALLRPGRHPRRVTLVEWPGPRERIRSVYVTAAVADPAEGEPARAEVEALVRTVQPRLELCRDLQAAAFAVGLPVGWFPPHPVQPRFEVFR